MPIEGTITAANAPVPQSGPGTFVPSTPTAPHAAEVAKATEGSPQKPVAAPPAEKPAETPPVDKQEENAAWRLASLAQKEKAARAARDEARKAEQGLKARQAEIEAREARIREAEENHQRKLQAYRANPLELLKEYGLDYNQLSEYVARGNWTPEQMQAMAIKQAQETAASAAAEVAQARKEAAEREATLRKELDEKDTKGKQAQLAGAIGAFKNELAEFFQTDPETYELSTRNQNAAVEAAFEYIDEQFEKTGKMISKKEAADYVEQRLYEEINKLISGTKKFGGPAKETRPPATLHNKLGAKPAAAPEPRGEETEAERRARVTRDIEQIWAMRRK